MLKETPDDVPNQDRVIPSDIGTKASGRNRFSRMRAMLGLSSELTETRLLIWDHDAGK